MSLFNYIAPISLFIVMSNLPFDEYKIKDTENIFVRHFGKGLDDTDLKWHRDREDRIVKSIQPTDWKLQIDNQIPKSLNEELFIPKGVYHRLIAGTNDLNIKLIKK